MATLQPFFELDKTGTSLVNRKDKEVYTLPDTAGNSNRAISLLMGCFFTKNIEIFDGYTNVQLRKGVDFIITEVYTSLSIIFENEIAATVVITNPSVSRTVKVSYNFLGSLFSNTLTSISTRINQEARESELSPLQWNLLNNVKTFIPSDYARQIGSGVGFETIVYGIESIRSTLLYGDFNLDVTLGQFIDNFIVVIDKVLNNKVTIEYREIIENFKKQFTKELLGLDKVQNMGLADPEVVRHAVVRGFKFDVNQDGYVAIKALSRFKEELYNNLVSSEHTGIGRHYGVYGLPLLTTLHSLRNGAGIIIDSLTSFVTSGITFNKVVYPDYASPNDKWSIVKITNNRKGQGGVLWGTNMTTGELYVGKLKDVANDPEVLTWTKLYGEYDLEKALDSLTNHINDIENPHKTNKHQIDLGNVENLPLADYEDLACRVPSDKYVSHKFLLGFMSSYMTGLKTAEDLKTMNCDENEVIRNIKLLFAPCGPCGPCCEPNLIPVVTDAPNIPLVDPYGQLTGWFCENGSRWDVFTDGKGGTFTKEHEYDRNSPLRESDGCAKVNGSAN